MQRKIKFHILTEGQKNGVSETCKKYNISRTIYYRWLKRYKEKGFEGLDTSKKDFVPANKTNADVEQALLNLIKAYPSYGPRAIKYLLEEVGYKISESAVYNVMKRHDLTNKSNRLRFAKRGQKIESLTLPNLMEISSGECWTFWVTNYGKFEQIGQIYEYTFLDAKSRIACTRLYQTLELSNFEDLLTAVALPVAQSLQLNTKYLCFDQDATTLKASKKNLDNKVKEIIQASGFEVDILLLEDLAGHEDIMDAKKHYTDQNISFLLTRVRQGMDFDELKLAFQTYLRDYNISIEQPYDDGNYTPVQYHNKLTNTSLILPLWAYIERQY